MSKFKEDIASEVIDEIKSRYDILSWKITKKVCSAFTGATANAHGDIGGTLAAYPVFTVDGDVVIAAIWGICNTTLTGATGTISVGVAGNTAGLIAVETATEIVAGNVYVSATQAVGIAPVAQTAMIALSSGADIIETAATADITDGQIDYYVIWAPVEKNAKVVAA